MDNNGRLCAMKLRLRFSAPIMTLDKIAIEILPNRHQSIVDWLNIHTSNIDLEPTPYLEIITPSLTTRKPQQRTKHSKLG